ncbi:MAG: 1,4-alpha-glucan branching protein domain-containing protein [Promethearchaeota archaeon]
MERYHMNGVFSLMLHAHIPYCRKSGVWPAGEEWLFEAMAETYIPLLSIFRRFQRDNLKPRVMIGIVPILAEQLADKYMNDRFHEYMEDKIFRTEKDIERFRGNPSRLKIANFYLSKFQKIYKSYKEDFYANILGSLKWLQDEGIIEILTSAATHGFLPLIKEDCGVYSQIHVGVKTYEKFFQRKPRGFWLPECAYRWREDGRCSIDEWLADEDIKYFFVENIGIERAEFIENKNKEIHPTTYRGYKLESGVYVFGRNQATGKQVWSPEIGYPGDPYYREFHKKDSNSGLYYWRVSEKNQKENQKGFYNPDVAAERVNIHADHFCELISEELSDYTNIIKECSPIIVSPYDCELYGHWWYEGVEWIERIYRNLLNNNRNYPVECLTLEEYIALNEDTFSTIRMGLSSWGLNGDFSVWKNNEHGWIWPYINSASLSFAKMLQNVRSSGRELNSRDNRILKQGSRELLLMQGSDWPFLLFTKQAKEYANQRFHNHHQRFLKLLWAAKNLDDLNRIFNRELEEMEDIDNPWADIDYHLFKSKEQTFS